MTIKPKSLVDITSTYIALNRHKIKLSPDTQGPQLPAELLKIIKAKVIKLNEEVQKYLQQESPFTSAAYEGKVDILQELMIYYKFTVHSTSSLGDTALHKAALSGQVPTVRFLIKNGANVNAKNFRQQTPLHEAAKNHVSSPESKNMIEVIQLLINNGAKVNARDHLQATPLDEAGSVEIVKILLGYNAELGHPHHPFARQAEIDAFLKQNKTGYCLIS